MNALILSKVVCVAMFSLFLPLTAVTYYVFRRHRRMAELERIFALLHTETGYRQSYEAEKSLAYFVWAVTYASLVSVLGLALLFLGPELGLDTLPSVSMKGLYFPQEGSRIIFGVAFLGAYVWGLQYVLRRYTLNDLVPSVYYELSLRMLFAALLALMLYNGYQAVAGDKATEEGVSVMLWPTLAFIMGMFPQRGVRWLQDRLPLLAPDTDPSVRSAPLDMIEGVETHDRWRLEELGIDTCYDLAMADFVPLILKTPYSARQVADWILQAKLCVYCGGAMKDLRQHGIRTIIDLRELPAEGLQMLVSQTSATQLALERALEEAQRDQEIQRLRQLSQVLGRFWEQADDTPSQPASA